MKVFILDYGVGNLRSLANACEHLGWKPEISLRRSIVEKAEKLVLPGVGNFGRAMQTLRKLAPELKKRIEDNLDTLGICLGIQLLFERSEEARGVRGLGFIKGVCERFPKGLKVPHMGWNEVQILKRRRLLRGIEDREHFYFLHSYYLRPSDESITSAVSEYGGVTFPAVIETENLCGTQFHPEKSGRAGLKLLENFLSS